MIIQLDDFGSTLMFSEPTHTAVTFNIPSSSRYSRKPPMVSDSLATKASFLVKLISYSLSPSGVF